MTAEQIARSFFFVLFLFLLYQAGSMMAPYFGPILAAFTMAVVCYPLHRRVGRLFKKNPRPTLHAILSILIVVVFMISPMIFVVSSTISEARAMAPEIKLRLQTKTYQARSWWTLRQDWRDRLPAPIVERLDESTEAIEGRLQRAAEGVLQFLVGSATDLAKDALAFLFNLFLFLLILFFLFRDGEAMFRYLSDHLPLNATVKARLEQKIEDTVIGVVRGSVVVGLMQGLFAMIGFAMVGTRASVLLGCLTAIASLIPAIGTAIIWVPVCIYYFVSGALGKGLFLLIWGIALGFVDNIARPIVVGQKAQMSFLWLSLALMGGLSVFGFKGLLLGPLIFALLPIFLEFFRTSMMNSKSSRP